METMRISWGTVEGAVEDLADKLRDVPHDFALVVPRGGLVIAGLLSHKIDIPYIHTCLRPWNKSFQERHNVLIIDDIFDTGGTYLRLHSRWPNAKLVVPFIKDHGIPWPDSIIWGRQIPTSWWIKFPWETEEEPNERSGTRI